MPACITLLFLKLFLVSGKKCDQGFCYLLVCGTISVNGILKNHLRLLAHHQGEEAELYKELYHHKQYKVRLPRLPSPSIQKRVVTQLWGVIRLGPDRGRQGECTLTHISCCCLISKQTHSSPHVPELLTILPPLTPTPFNRHRPWSGQHSSSAPHSLQWRVAG